MTKQISAVTCEKIYIIMNELNLFKKLPNEKQLFIEEKRDSDFKFEYDKNIPLKEQIKDKETMVVLSYLFLKYINKDKQTKQVLLDRYKKNEIEYRQEINEKYNVNNLFKESNKLENKANIKACNKIDQKTAMIEYKENIFKKLINKIKSLLHLN